MTPKPPQPVSSDVSTLSDANDAPQHPLAYRIPADPHVMCPKDPGVLNPSPEVLPRRMGDGANDLRALRDRALAEACYQAADECASTFELPPR